MKNILAALAIAAACLPPAAHAMTSAQDEESTRAARAEMAKLAPKMQGRWKGAGWIRISRDTTVHTTSEEIVAPKLGGSALAVEGIHHDARSNVLVHHALGILAWDVGRKEFRMQTALAQGKTGSHPGRMEDGRFVWFLEVPNGPITRYTISFDGGRWKEVGESSMDGGTKWFKFMELDLERVGDAPR